MKLDNVCLNMGNGGLIYSIEQLNKNESTNIPVYVLRQSTLCYSLSTYVDILLPSKSAVSALIKILKDLEQIIPEESSVYDMDEAELVDEFGNSK